MRCDVMSVCLFIINNNTRYTVIFPGYYSFLTISTTPKRGDDGIHEDNYVAVYCSVVYECTYYNSTVIYT